MPTYQKCPTRHAAGGTLARVRHAMPGYCAQDGSASKMPSLVRWSTSVGKTDLIKVGPRIPKMATKLAALVDHFKR